MSCKSTHTQTHAPLHGKNMCHKLELSVLRGSYEMDGPLFWSRLKYFNSYKYDKNYFWCRCILFPKDTS